MNFLMNKKTKKGGKTNKKSTKKVVKKTKLNAKKIKKEKSMKKKQSKKKSSSRKKRKPEIITIETSVEPGLLTMENSGEDTNNSQFIITLKDMQEFDKKHVIFGRVVKGLYKLYELEEGATITDIN